MVYTLESQGNNKEKLFGEMIRVNKSKSFSSSLITG